MTTTVYAYSADSAAASPARFVASGNKWPAGLAVALTLLTSMTGATAWPAFHPMLLLVY
jgi:hypothetical protein